MQQLQQQQQQAASSKGDGGAAAAVGGHSSLAAASLQVGGAHPVASVLFWIACVPGGGGALCKRRPKLSAAVCTPGCLPLAPVRHECSFLHGMNATVYTSTSAQGAEQAQERIEACRWLCSVTGLLCYAGPDSLSSESCAGQLISRSARRAHRLPQ
jgi:hypothetical protein